MIKTNRGIAKYMLTVYHCNYLLRNLGTNKCTTLYLYYHCIKGNGTLIVACDEGLHFRPRKIRNSFLRTIPTPLTYHKQGSL